MQRLSALARWIFTVIFTGFVLPIALKFIEHLGLYDRPREAASEVLNFLLSFAELPWLRATALGLGGFVAGLWLDWLLRKMDGSRAKARGNLGFEMRNLAHDIERERQNLHFDWTWLRPNLISTFLKAKNFG